MKFFLLICFFVFSLRSEEIQVHKDIGSRNLTKELSWLVTDENFNIQEILDENFQALFQKNKSEIVNLGFQSKVVWLQIPISLKKDLEKNYVYFKYAQFEKINLYFVETSSNKTIYKTFLSQESSFEKFFFPDLVFVMPELNTEGKIFLYVELKYQLPIYFQVWVLDEVNFYKIKEKKFLFNGFFYGILFLAILYSLTSFYAIRHYGILYYIVFLICLVFLDNINKLYFTNSLFVFLKKTLGSLSIVFFLLMFQEIIFDSIQEKNKKFINFLVRLSLVHFIISAFFPLETSGWLLYFFGIIIGLSLFFILIYFIILREINSLWFLINFLFLIFTSLINFFIGYHILPDKYFIDQNLKISIILQIFILSFFFAHQIEKSRKLLKQINLDLELKVTERTLKLSQTLNELETRDAIFQEELKLSLELLKSLSPNQNTSHSLVEFRFFQENFLQIGGDFFDIIERSDGSVYIFMADVSGHGISAALLVALYKLSFRNVLQKGNFLDPETVLLEMNAQITSVLNSYKYLTVFLISLTPDGNLKYSSAGHRPAFLFRTKLGKAKILSTRGMLLGISKDNVKFEQKETKIEVGDRLLLYTDGLTEVFTLQGKPLGSNGLYEIFLKTQRSSLDSSFEEFLEEWKKITANQVLSDDSSFLLLEFHGNSYR